MLFYWYVQRIFAETCPASSSLKISLKGQIARGNDAGQRFLHGDLKIRFPVLKLIAGEMPDLVLLNVMMQEISGFDVLKSMRPDAHGLAAGASAF